MMTSLLALLIPARLAISCSLPSRTSSASSTSSSRRLPSFPPRLFGATNTMASEIDNLSSREAKTVCEALGRYEDTLRGAVREIHVDIQVEALSRSAGLPQEWRDEAERSPPAVGSSSPVPAFSADRFSNLAKLAVSGRSQSVDLDDHHKPEFRRVFSSSIIENGHQSSSGQAKASHELTSFYSDSSPEAHAPAMTLQMPHLPVTAVTRISEKFSGETIHSAGTTSASTGLLGQNQSKNEMALKTSNQSGKIQGF
uniref:Uncharacterized protein n=1 Tax=Meleagris gallopavo TaxID=9103 RepID=G1N9I1_MELGA